MPTGTVKFFNKVKGFPASSSPRAADRTLRPYLRRGTLRDVHAEGNQRVSYDVEEDQRGKMKATNLKAAEGSE